MARSRNIKPGFFQNEDLVELPYECRLLFIGLWTLADREGRLENRPKKIKMQLFPADNLDVSKAILGLADKKLVTLYVVDNIEYIWIDAFLKHQHPHHKETKSVIPEYKSPVKVGASQVKVESSLSDSLNPITDSLNPISKIVKSKIKPIGIEFDIFYSQYPKKTSKATAKKFWNKMKEPDKQLAINGINNHCYGKEVKFMKNPSSYLRESLWDDEPVQQEKTRYEQHEESTRKSYQEIEQLGREIEQLEREKNGTGIQEIMVDTINTLPATEIYSGDG